MYPTPYYGAYCLSEWANQAAGRQNNKLPQTVVAQSMEQMEPLGLELRDSELEAFGEVKMGIVEPREPTPDGAARCEICGRPAKGPQYCQAHLQRMAHNGSPYLATRIVNGERVMLDEREHPELRLGCGPRCSVDT